MLIHENVLDLVGNTPMVDVSRLSPNPNVRLVAKLESQNPFGSVKDRIAKLMIETAEKEGHLVPGQTIVEPSSGNTGIALAAIARLKGYPIKILMPTSVSIERRQMLEVYGAEIILTPGEEGSNGAVKRALALHAEHPDWFMPYQYANDANPRAHYEGTGPEICVTCPDHPLRGRPRNEWDPDGHGPVPEGAEARRQGDRRRAAARGERVEGLRNLDEGYIPPLFETWQGFELLDRKRVVRLRESLEWARRSTTVRRVRRDHGAASPDAAKVASEIDEA
ncbi:MAG: PLP-dependent cysteine synthase family protein [Ilumatobacteraceae bacterium]